MARSGYCGNLDPIVELDHRELCSLNARTGAATKANTQLKGSGIKGILKGLSKLWRDEQGQDIAEYAVMLAVILIIVIGTVKLIGTKANSTFSNVASSVQ